MTLELKPIHKQSDYGNILNFDGGQGTNPYCGTFIPEIHKKPSTKAISFRSCVNNDHGIFSGGGNTYAHNGSLLEQFDWNHIEVGQRNVEGQYEYYVKIVGTEVYTKINNQPVSFMNVHAFIGTHSGAFNGETYTDIEIRNVQGKVYSISVF